MTGERPGENDIRADLWDDAESTSLDDGTYQVEPFHALLSARRRRFILHYLVETPGVCFEFDDVVEALAARERAAEVDAPREHERDVAVSLHHVHVPKLADAGVVEYDSRSGAIRYHGDDRLERCLAALDESVALER